MSVYGYCTGELIFLFCKFLNDLIGKLQAFFSGLKFVIELQLIEPVQNSAHVRAWRDAFVDEAVQIENYLNTVNAIEISHLENEAYREDLFASDDIDEQRRIRRSINRRNNKIFELLKEWRFEGGVIDRVERIIREQIDWFDAMNKMISTCAESLSVPVSEFRKNLSTKTANTENDN